MSEIPFGYITGPYYTYEIFAWVGPRRNRMEFMYVGRGRKGRAKTYYRLSKRKGVDRYLNPKTHNSKLDAAMASIRETGCEPGIIAHDHGADLAACKRHEQELISKHGRRDQGTGTLYNRNRGG